MGLKLSKGSLLGLCIGYFWAGGQSETNSAMNMSQVAKSTSLLMKMVVGWQMATSGCFGYFGETWITWQKHGASFRHLAQLLHVHAVGPIARLLDLSRILLIFIGSDPQWRMWFACCGCRVGPVFE